MRAAVTVPFRVATEAPPPVVADAAVKTVDERAMIEPGRAIAKEILFIDPYFTPKDQRFKRPLQAFLQIVAQRPPGIPVAVSKFIQVTTTQQAQKVFLRLNARGICPAVGATSALTFLFWVKESHSPFSFTSCVAKCAFIWRPELNGSF